MNVDYTVTALMFPAIPLLMSVYANRFHTLSNLIRKIHDEYVWEKHIPPEMVKIHTCICELWFFIQYVNSFCSLFRYDIFS